MGSFRSIAKTSFEAAWWILDAAWWIRMERLKTWNDQNEVGTSLDHSLKIFSSSHKKSFLVSKEAHKSKTKEITSKI